MFLVVFSLFILSVFGMFVTACVHCLVWFSSNSRVSFVWCDVFFRVWFVFEDRCLMVYGRWYVL